MYRDHDARSIAMFRIRRPNYLRIMISSSNQTPRRGIPLQTGNLKLDIHGPHIPFLVPTYRELL